MDLLCEKNIDRNEIYRLSQITGMIYAIYFNIYVIEELNVKIWWTVNCLVNGPTQYTPSTKFEQPKFNKKKLGKSHVKVQDVYKTIYLIIELTR